MLGRRLLSEIVTEQLSKDPIVDSQKEEIATLGKENMFLRLVRVPSDPL